MPLKMTVRFECFATKNESRKTLLVFQTNAMIWRVYVILKGFRLVTADLTQVTKSFVARRNFFAPFKLLFEYIVGEHSCFLVGHPLNFR